MKQYIKKNNNYNLKLTTDTFIEKAKCIHGDKYDYSLVEYKNSKTRVAIICTIHGIFEQVALNHFKGGCVKCCDDAKRKTTEQFIIEANIIHQNKYDYSKSIYFNGKTKIIIICPEHGEFLQWPASHTTAGQGCPKCKLSKGEQIINSWLLENKINFLYNHRFDDCRNINALPFDFYLPEHNTCIEFDGEQHYKPISWVSDKNAAIENLQIIQYRDYIKTDYCEQNQIKLIRITYRQIRQIASILSVAF